MKAIGIGSRVWDAQGRVWRVVGVTVRRRIPVALLVEAEHSSRGLKRLRVSEVFASLADALTQARGD